MTASIITGGRQSFEAKVIQVQSLVRRWLARRLCAILAQEVYQLCRDESSGRHYYKNVRTARVCWSVPTLLVPNKREELGGVYDTPLLPVGPPQTLNLGDGTGMLQRQSDEVNVHSPTFDRSASEAFLALCTEERRHLFEAHRRAVMRSVRHWEHQQLREKTAARTNRLAKMLSDNHERLVNLQNGAKTYNLKSIRQAAVHGDISRLVELLNLGFHADSPSAMGLTPLLGASQSGCLEAVKILLQRGADVNRPHIKTKRTALMEASARESPEVVRELLRYGARLRMQDAHGETAFDCAKDPRICRWLSLAASVWSQESAEVFPNPFRSAGTMLLLIQQRQGAQDVERRMLMKRNLSALRPTILRSAAEAKMLYDEQVRSSNAQVTLLRKVEALRQADERFDSDRARLFELVEQALLSKAEAEQPRTLPTASITAILAFCDRHWFDHGRRQRQRRHCNRIMAMPIEPTKRPVGRQAVPEAIKAEWNDVHVSLEGHCDELRRLQKEERPDPDHGVTRTHGGQTMSSLHVCVREAQHLPYRDPRVHEPIDPLIRLSVRDQTEHCTMFPTDSRLGDRHPTWNAEFTFGIETTKADLVIQLMDAQRNEVAGEVTVALRTLVDQKSHDEWLIFPPSLRQHALEKTPREHAARVHLTLRFVHTPSVLITRAIQQLLVVRADVLRRKLALMQSELEECMQKLTI